MYQNDIINK